MIVESLELSETDRAKKSTERNGAVSRNKL